MGGCAVPPSVFSAVLSRFELSFIHDTRLIDEIFGLVTDKSSCFSHLTELRFIRCSGVTNLTLEQISRRCPRLCSLFLNGCVNVTSKGIAYLVTNWSCWQATNLTAIVCGTAISLQDFMAVKLWMETAIIVYHSCSYEGTRLKWRWTTKSLSGRKAHKVSVWENGKILSLQDYTANDVNEIIKVVVGFKPE